MHYVKCDICGAVIGDFQDSCKLEVDRVYSVYRNHYRIDICNECYLNKLAPIFDNAKNTDDIMRKQ